MTLRDCPAGHAVRLHRLALGQTARERLVELGLVPGVRVRVIGQGAAGGRLVAVGDARVALDGGTCGSLVVEPE